LNPPFSIAVAKACLDASALSYKKATVESGVAHALIQEREIEVDPDRPGRFVVIVAFRGTENIKDWMTDGRMRLVEATRMGTGVKVHVGFYGSLTSVLPEVLGELEQYRMQSPEIFVTGHSKGGGEAMLAAPLIRAAGFEVAGVYTFGQPRVGNGSFASMYDLFLGARTFRFVNEEDIVPRVPVPGLICNYRHAAHEVFFPSDRTGFEFDPSILLKFLSDKAGVARDFVWRRVSVIQDHFVTEYQHRFSNVFRTEIEAEVAA
jgi:triacylglycerol lipase